MPHLIKERQKIHDEKVRKIAKKLREIGYFVRADLPGHKKPPRFGGRVPDIYAHKKGEKLIYEIETKESLLEHHEQQKTLQKAAEKIGAEFKIIVV